MSRDFIGIRALEGELMISHKKGNFGLTVSTMEVVLQKPHVNYHVKLSDIISITPYEHIRSRKITAGHGHTLDTEFVPLAYDMKHYRFHVKEMTVHNRSGIFKLPDSELILPVLPELLSAISKHSGMFMLDL